MGAAIAGIIRHIITAIGGGMVTNGTISGDQLEAVIGAVVTIVGVIWSVFSKRNQNPPPTIVPLIAFMLLFPTMAFAQLQFPITVNVVWDAYPATENITKFTVTHNGTPVDVMPSACTATECAKAITLTSAGPHVVSVTATNMWGTSAPNSITFTASSPGRSGNLRIRLN